MDIGFTAGRERESTAHIVPPGQRGKPHLPLGRLHAQQRSGSQGLAGGLGEMPRQLGGLIEAATQETSTMQWNGHDAITGIHRSVTCPQHPQRHQAGEIGPVLIFQPVHELAGGSLMACDGAQAVKRRRFGNRLCAHETVAVIPRERNAQNLAKRAVDKGDIPPAIRT